MLLNKSRQIFLFPALKVLSALKQKFEATKFTFPKYFKLNKNLPESDDSDSEDEIPRNRQRSSTPILRTQPQPVISIKPEIARQSKIRESVNLSAEDSEISAIFRPSNSTIAASSSSLRPITPVTTDRPMTPAMRRVLNESVPQLDRSATPFLNQTGRVQCQAMTFKGAQCRNAAAAGYNKCRLHNNN